MDAMKVDLARAAPLWGDFSVAGYATYLGFVLGPQRSDRSWNKPVQKYLERAKDRGQIGGGLQLTARVPCVHIFRYFLRGTTGCSSGQLG